MLISFLSPLLFTSLLLTATCKASPDSHFAFLHFFSMGMVLIPVSCTMSRTSVHRYLFKKIRGTKGTFHAKMSTIKDRNGLDLTEAEDIKKRWQEYTEGLYKKDLHDPDNHDGVITHLEPDILECEVKWALESITMNKASGGDGIPVELFHILKDDAVKVVHSIYQQIWKTQQWPQEWKRSVFIPIPKKGNAKECSNYCTVARISHALVTHSGTLAWKIPWKEEPGRLQSMGSLGVGHD